MSDRAVERSYPVEGPLDVAGTLRLMTLWESPPWFRTDESGAWFARRTAAGPATVQLACGDGRLWARAWGAGADALLDAVPAMVGLADPGFAAIPRHHPGVHELVRRRPGLRTGRSGDLYPSLIAIGLSQKVTGKSSNAALRALAWRWGEVAPGPRADLRLLPAPRALAARGYAEFHALNVERRRAELILRIAARATALQRAVAMSPVDARAHLEKLPGIGPWTSGVVTGGALGDPDAVPTGDYHLPDYVAWNLVGEPRADDARMLALLAPFAGHRGRLVRLLKTAGEAPPKYGPRTPVLDFRRRD